MKILESADEFIKHDYTVVTIGTFDGVHFGHQKILANIIKEAKAHNGISVVVTFWPHPRFVLEGPNSTLKLLTTFEMKANLLKELGIDVLVKIEFTKEFSKTTSDEFVRKILIERLGTTKLIIGYDHHFGKDREGSFEYLQANASRYGFEVAEIPRQDIDHIGVSSTRVRKALLSGEVDIANEYLGRMYSFIGKVVHGEKVGRDLGYPTANVEPLHPFQLIPADGVYAVELTLHEELLYGMLYIGNKPTMDGTKKSIEVNIFNFDRDIYGEFVELRLVQQLRGDVKFPNLEELTKQLAQDKEDTIKVIKQYNPNYDK